MSAKDPSFPAVFTPDQFWPADPPPETLYKYLVADRIGDVLENGMVRFTHLLDTNDVFEVRKTFQRFAGPKFMDMLTEIITENITSEYVEKQIRDRLLSAGVNVPMRKARRLLEKKMGMSIESFIRSEMLNSANNFANMIDTVKSPEEFIQEIGSILMCFSLSARYDIPSMWAHYAGNHTGLVVAFDSRHPWFKDEQDNTRSALQRIKYLDEQSDELLDDIQAVFSSKSTAWAYEQEWRMNCVIKDIEKTVSLGSEQIHLRSFPPEAVSSVILGSKASNDTVERARRALHMRYPHAKLKKAIPERMTAKFTLEDI